MSGFTTLEARKPLAKSIGGTYLAFYEDDSPVVIFLDDQPFVGVFSTAAKLAESMGQMQVQNYRLKQIANPDDFLNSVTGQQVRICLDPRVVNGKTRFTELIWEESLT